MSVQLFDYDPNVLVAEVSLTPKDRDGPRGLTSDRLTDPAPYVSAPRGKGVRLVAVNRAAGYPPSGSYRSQSVVSARRVERNSTRI